MKYRILRIINRFNIGGPTYNVSYLSKYMEDDFETLLVGGRHDEGEEGSLYIPHQLGLDPVIIDMERSIRPIKDYRAYKEIRKIIRDFKPHIVHTHASKAGALGRLAASKENIPVIVHTFHGHVFHSYFGRLKTCIFKNVERYLAKKATDIIAISSKQKEELVNEFGITTEIKTSIVPLGFNLERFQNNKIQKREQFRRNYELREETVAIGIIGRLAAIKDHQFFIKVAERTLKKIERENIMFLIIGDGSEKSKIEKMIHQLPDKFKKKFVFTSWIKDIDVAIAGLDLILLTSKNEGTPVSLIEAQAGGKPVISTDVGGVRDIVIQNKTGYYVTQNELEGYTQKVIELIKDEKKRRAMGQEGRKHAFEKFSHTRLCSDMKELYINRLNEKKIKI